MVALCSLSFFFHPGSTWQHARLFLARSWSTPRPDYVIPMYPGVKYRLWIDHVQSYGGCVSAHVVTPAFHDRPAKRASLRDETNLGHEGGAEHFVHYEHNGFMALWGYIVVKVGGGTLQRTTAAGTASFPCR